VIGSTSFLGGALVRELARGSVQVSVMNRARDPQFAGEQHTLDQLEALDASFEQVFLLAAQVPYGRMNEPSAELTEANVMLPCRVARQLRDCRLIFASSVSVYGTPLELPVTEDHPYHRPSAYGVSKLAGELAVQACREHVVLRFSSLYGPRMRAATFVPRIIRDARQHGRIVLQGDGARTQDYLFVDEAAAMLAAAGRGRQTGVFNAVSGAATSNRDVAAAVADACGGVRIEYQGEDTTPSAAYSRSRWDAAFDPVARVGLREGIARTVRDV
jgi:UDP-glucose 4-epimerase